MSEKNKKRIVTSLAALFVMLAMISLCLLGSTMARYTTGGTTTTTAQVAHWGYSATGQSATATFSKLSPSIDGSKGDINTSSVELIATITVDSTTTDVDATTTMTIGDLTYYSDASSSYSNWNASGFASTGTPSSTEANSTLKIEAYLSTTQNISNYTDLTSTYSSTTTELTSTYSGSLNANTIYYVYAVAVWTTQSNEIDTWFGQNIYSVEATITCSIVQSSTTNGSWS